MKQSQALPVLKSANVPCPMLGTKLQGKERSFLLLSSQEEENNQEPSYLQSHHNDEVGLLILSLAQASGSTGRQKALWFEHRELLFTWSKRLELQCAVHWQQLARRQNGVLAGTVL